MPSASMSLLLLLFFSSFYGVMKADRHLPTLTVEETFRFAFDSMAGGTHKAGLGGGSEMLNDEQKALVEWMDSRYFKACVHLSICVSLYACVCVCVCVCVCIY